FVDYRGDGLVLVRVGGDYGVRLSDQRLDLLIHLGQPLGQGRAVADQRANGALVADQGGVHRVDERVRFLWIDRFQDRPEVIEELAEVARRLRPRGWADVAVAEPT